MKIEETIIGELHKVTSKWSQNSEDWIAIGYFLNTHVICKDKMYAELTFDIIYGLVAKLMQLNGFDLEKYDYRELYFSKINSLNEEKHVDIRSKELKDLFEKQTNLTFKDE